MAAQSMTGYGKADAVGKGYSEDEFARLLHDGVALGDRETRLMSPTSRVRFANFTREEVAAVHAFLRTL